MRVLPSSPVSPVGRREERRGGGRSRREAARHWNHNPWERRHPCRRDEIGHRWPLHFRLLSETPVDPSDPIDTSLGVLSLHFLRNRKSEIPFLPPIQNAHGFFRSSESARTHKGLLSANLWALRIRGRVSIRQLPPSLPLRLSASAGDLRGRSMSTGIHRPSPPY